MARSRRAATSVEPAARVSVFVSHPFSPPYWSGSPPRLPANDPFDGTSDDLPVFDELEGMDDLSPEAPAVGGREGLPPDFRMRADSHYVEHITRETTVPPIRHVHVSEIDGPKPEDGGDLQPLIESIGEFGVLQPLLVRRDRGRFALIAGTRRLAAALAVGLTTVPCLVHDVDDETARALADADNLRGRQPDSARDELSRHDQLLVASAKQFAESANTMATCLGLIDDRGRPLREQVAATLMRTEARRAAWLARAFAVLNRTVSMAPRPLVATALLETVAEAVRSDPRLSGTSLVTTSPNGTAPTAADSGLLTVGMSGLLLGLVLALRVQGVAAPVIEMRVRASGGLLWLDLVERQLSVGRDALAGAAGTDPWPWPGGPEAVLGIAIAQRVAALHDGRLEAVPIEPRGCRLSFGLPQSR